MCYPIFMFLGEIYFFGGGRFTFETEFPEDS